MDKFLFVEFNIDPICYCLNHFESTLIINGTLFKEYNNNDYSGFYDWLRTDSGTIAGVCYTSMDVNNPLIDKLGKLYYVQVERDRHIYVYFGADKSFNQQISQDQDFGLCKVYTSDTSTICIAFDMQYLTEKEFKSIKNIEDH